MQWEGVTLGTDKRDLLLNKSLIFNLPGGAVLTDSPSSERSELFTNLLYVYWIVFISYDRWRQYTLATLTLPRRGLEVVCLIPNLIFITLCQKVFLVAN